MKLRTRVLTLITVAAIAITSMGMSAFAAEGDIKPANIRLSPSGTRTLTKDSTLELSYEIRPDDANVMLDVTWSTSDPNVAEVDDGTVTAIGPGTCEIKVITENRKPASITIIVPGKVESQDTDTPKNKDGQDIDYSSSKAATGTSTKTVKAPRETVVNAVRNAGTSTPILSGYNSVSAETLQAAAKAGKSKISFDTKSGNSFLGRVTFTPANAAKLTGDIKTGVFAGTDETKAVQALFDKYNSNTTKVIYCEQAKYGMTVQITAKVGNISASKLKFYSYNKSTNKVSALNIADAKVDSKGFATFSTTVGGFIIASNGALVN